MQSNIIQTSTSRATKQSKEDTDEAACSDSASFFKAQEKPRALIVDDVSDVTEMLSVFLTHAGYEVETTESSATAFELAKNSRFDVVISDIGMPRMNGYELVQAMRELPGYNSVPMIAVTGFSIYDDRDRSIHSGFSAHLTKPIDPLALLELIERLRD